MAFLDSLRKPESVDPMRKWIGSYNLYCIQLIRFFKIRDLLRKPWNPYVVGRHASLTQKSKILKEATLRVFAGWTANSDMPRRYIHLFGNAACEDILEAYGLVSKDQQISSLLQNKQCPNCSEPCKPDAKFCTKCRMVLAYDA